MRKISKYKALKKNKILMYSFPYKILKFKSSKWKLYKKTFKKVLKRNFLYNSLLGCVKSKTWDRKRLFFRKSLQLKRNLQQIFDNTFNFNFIKKILFKSKKKNLNSYNIIKLSIVNLGFRLDILLTRLFFFSNIFEARKAIKSGRVLVNNKIINTVCFLNKGDTVSLINNQSINKDILDKEFKSSIFYPFVEIDYYIKKFTIIKNKNELNKNELNLFIPIYLDIIKISRILSK